MHRLIAGIVMVAVAALLFFAVLADKSLSTSVGQGPAENLMGFFLLGPAILGFTGLILIITAVVGDYRSNWNRGER